MLSMLKRLISLLIEPSPHIHDVATRRKSRLLAIFLLVMMLNFVSVDITYILTIPGYVVPWYGYIFFLSAYFLNRMRFYKIAAGLIVFMFSAVTFVRILSGQATIPGVVLNYLVLSLIVGSIFLSVQGTAILALGNIVGIVLLPRLASQYVLDFNAVVGPLSIVTISAVLILVSMHHRDQIEKDRQAEISENEGRLQLALKAAKMETWSWNIETGEVVWSDKIKTMFGLGGKPFDGKYETYLSLIHPDDLPNVQNSISKALSDENYDYVVEHRLVWPHGEVRWIEGRGKVFRDESGKSIRMAGSVVDITDRKEAEVERENLIDDLAGKNTELEQFTYTVSHDLKAPIITIKGFLGFLGDDVRAGNQKRIDSDIARITEATDKMHRLLNELLELSRIGRMTNPPVLVPLGELVVEAVEILQGRLQTHPVQLTVAEDLPVVQGDRQRLLEVIQNLIDNAAKFSADQPAPSVEIGAENNEEGEPVIFVRDNGIGIPLEHHERIFGLFNKLDPAAEGTGVGLSLVKRIIEFHGGRIWVQSEAGKGAAFYFTLPMSQSSQDNLPDSI